MTSTTDGQGAPPRGVRYPISLSPCETADEFRSHLEGVVAGCASVESTFAQYPDASQLWAPGLHRQPPFSEDHKRRIAAKKALQATYNLPRKCNFEVAAVCPLRCPFCDLHDLSKSRRKNLMPLEDFRKIWRYMESFTDIVEFTGGEPLLNNGVYEMIEEANRSGVYTVLTTNGQLLNEDRAERLLHACPSQVLIAYDGVSEDEYSSSRVKGTLTRLRTNVEYFVKRRESLGIRLPEINLQMVVTKNNYRDTESFFRDAESIGADRASLKPVFLWPGASEEFKENIIKNFICLDSPISFHKFDAAGKLLETRSPGICPNDCHVHIGSGGEVIPCWYILKDTWVAGCAVDVPFFDIWYSDEYIEFRRRMKEGVVHQACRYCIGVGSSSLFVSRALRGTSV